MDEKLYRETFSKLRASDEAKEEVIQMAMRQHTPRRLSKALRTAAIAAVTVLALAATAGAADLATGGLILQNLRKVWSDGYETRYTASDADGNEYLFSVLQCATAHLEDGRLIINVLDEELDATDELEETGEYHYETTAGERSIQVDVTGTLEDWTLTEAVNCEGIIYSSTLTSGNEATIGGSGGDVESAAVPSRTMTAVEEMEK